MTEPTLEKILVEKIREKDYAYLGEVYDAMILFNIDISELFRLRMDA